MILVPMPTVPVMHEDMHQRAGKQQQKRQGPNHMRQVLAQ
jgi:hypothetical protein